MNAKPHVSNHHHPHLAVGRYEITVVSDGHLVLPTSLLALDAPIPERLATLESSGLGGDEFQPAANIPLVRDGQDLIVFDTGGHGYQAGLGALAQNMRSAGIDPADVTKSFSPTVIPITFGALSLRTAAFGSPMPAITSAQSSGTSGTGKMSGRRFRRRSTFSRMAHVGNTPLYGTA